MKAEKLTVGILAHVDAGKTTLAESLLYLSGTIRKLGRVDHQDAFLDTYSLEKSKGITIFSKQAELKIGEKQVTLLDTPGHVDFSAEMERTLQVLDYAILLISGADGIQGHVQTLWKLLRRYRIPTFLFINKMDQPGTDKQKLLEELKARLSDNCVDFDPFEEQEAFFENVAMSDEEAMESFLEHGIIATEKIQTLIEERKIFPCYFGSALKIFGVEELIQGFSKYTRYQEYQDAFSARVYKISRDATGNRLTHMKITGGTLKVKSMLRGQNSSWEEKVDQIRIYSGNGYEMSQEAAAGTICACTGLTKTFVGEGLGQEDTVNVPMLEPVLNYRLILPEGCNIHALLGNLRQLEEEEPLLHILWQEESGEIHAQLMGEVQIEVLQSMIKERFGVLVEFGTGSIVYKETILEPVEGVGHFEPLRHYAEVHLWMEPLEKGSGLVFETKCSEDLLDKNWQRLILTHLEEKKHAGILTGSEITDMKITLVAGRAHIKHTEGGDFRQSTYRAVRHGLVMTKSRLLEPVYEYRLELPADMVGRAMADIQRMHGSVSAPQLVEETAILTGTAPVSTMQGYQREVISYSRGKGQLFCTLKGYEPCHNEEEVVEKIGYQWEHDTLNPANSVFCSHGAGFIVEPEFVYDYMHLEGVYVQKVPMEDNCEEAYYSGSGRSVTPGVYNEDELKAIFERTYGSVKQERRGWNKTRKVSDYDSSYKGQEYRPKDSGKEYLLVDGYNIIFAWEDLKELSQVNIEAARNKLMDVLCNYQGYKKNIVILVFDAYKVEGNPGSSQKYHNIHVVYTKEAETADQYIEKVTHEIGRKHRVTVATSDALEQVIILGQGARRMSAHGLKEEIESVGSEIRGRLQETAPKGEKYYLAEHMPKDILKES